MNFSFPEISLHVGTKHNDGILRDVLLQLPKCQETQLQTRGIQQELDQLNKQSCEYRVYVKLAVKDRKMATRWSLVFQRVKLNEFTTAQE